MLAWLLSQLEGGGKAIALSRGERGNELRTGAAVADDGDGVRWSEGVVHLREAPVHFAHDVGGQSGINDEGDGERVGVGGEEGDVLTDAIFIDTETPPGQARDFLSVLVFDGDRDHDFGYTHRDGVGLLAGCAGCGRRGLDCIGRRGLVLSADGAIAGLGRGLTGGCCSVLV